MRKIKRIKDEDWEKGIFQLKSEIAVKEVKILKEEKRVQSTDLDRLKNRKDGLERVLKTKEMAKKESGGMTNDLFKTGGGSPCAT